MKNIKSRLFPMLAILALVSSPVLALDPHDTKTVTVNSQNTTASSGPQTITLVSATTNAVNSGTNSYTVQGHLKFDVPVNGPTILQLSKTVSGVTTVLTSFKIGGQDYASITYEIENVASGTVFNLQIVANNVGDPINVPSATIWFIGLAGNTSSS